MTEVKSTEERDWRAGCECGRVGLCFRCQAAARIEWLERCNASTENELGRANTKRLQAEHERDALIERVKWLVGMQAAQEDTIGRLNRKLLHPDVEAEHGA